MSTRDAATALRRLGLGARPGEMARIAADPRGFVAAQLADPAAATIKTGDLEPSFVVLAEDQRAQEAQRLVREATAKAGRPPSESTVDAQLEASRKRSPGTSPRPGAVRRAAYQAELAQRIEHGLATSTPFLERLVLFWSNHFAVSAGKGIVRGIAGGYEREVVRANVLGRFADMLKASAQHPAMLIYLDNQLSIGPTSRAGQNRGRGINENLAREILELHTLGVDGGYNQADVTNFARILTGWTIGVVREPTTEPGKFFYAANRHEPGAWTVVDRHYENRGQATGEQVLLDLARHPSTARHIARKLARHFVGDEAPAALATRLETAFRDSDGNLAVLARTLIEAPEVWATPPRKVVPPYDFALALGRGLALKANPQEVARLAAALGQPTWLVASPKGWPDDDDAWMGPSAVRERLRIAEVAARQADRSIDPRRLAEELIGDWMSEETRAAIARAESREQGLELAVMAPEFLRR